MAKGAPATLEHLTSGAVVVGVLPDEPVTVLASKWHGTNALTLTYTASVSLGQAVLYHSDESRLSFLSEPTRWTLDGDGADFRLAAEALRIQRAGLHEAMLAVSSSDVDPLPHQIRAVYGELLPRTPLRFLLADDPGAGKTIMAGLYARELLLRDALERCLIVAPGSLVEQWQLELSTRFGLDFEVFAPTTAEITSGRAFRDHPLSIARMDQLSRRTQLLDLLDHEDLDLVVVDEAHRMSASHSGVDVKATRRYQLGQRLSRVARNLLLMTATPHAGKEDDYQLFLALLDPDRFEGKYRPGAHSTDTTGLMRRMVKEELRTFEGRPLFPERIAETVPFALSDAESRLYEDVTRYVRQEMSRADALATNGDGQRSRTVGFAGRPVSRRFAYVTLGPDGTAVASGPAPYLDAEPLPPQAFRIAREVLSWLADGVEAHVTSWAVAQSLPQHVEDVRHRRQPALGRTREAVTKRLQQESNRWWAMVAKIQDDESAGRTVRISSLVLPAGLLQEAAVGDVPKPPPVDTTLSERRAVDAVLSAERALGRVPTQMPHSNPGYDIASLAPDGHTIYLEVKGRVVGANDFTVTANEVITGLNAGPRYRLALVELTDTSAQVRYLDDPFRGTDSARSR